MATQTATLTNPAQIAHRTPVGTAEPATGFTSRETAGRINRPVAVGIAFPATSLTTTYCVLSTIRQAIPQAGVSVSPQMAQAIDFPGFITANLEEVDDTNLSHCRMGGSSHRPRRLSGSVWFILHSFARSCILPSCRNCGFPAILVKLTLRKSRISRPGVAVGISPLPAPGSASG
jgi:hypothetical protein